MTPAPEALLSIVVPAHDGAQVLPRTLAALAASTLARDRWELIVVDDASADATATVAATFADRVVTLGGPRHGPAYARNRGVEASRGTWIVFVDADVAVHRDALEGIARTIAVRPEVDAVFGAYDDAPPAPGFYSQYRNLLHRYVHLRGAGEADTFWAGCGAVRRAAFEAVGGFNEQRYVRPQIEDIELGYRLRDRGARIVLDPTIQGTHLKRWTFWASTRTDLFDRAVPWVRLLRARGAVHLPGALNLRQGERARTVAVGLALAGAFAGAWLRSWELPAAAVAVVGAVVGSNIAMLRWFRAQRGLWFTVRVMPLNAWYYALSGVAVVVATLARPRRQHARGTSGTHAG